MLPTSRRRYVNRRLNMLDYFKELNERTSIVKRHGLFGRLKKISYEAKMQKRKFIDEYLKFDGVFILRMISSLTSEIVCKEILHELWTKRAICKHDRSSSNEDFYRSPAPPKNPRFMQTNEKNFSKPADSFSINEAIVTPPYTSMSPSGLYANESIQNKSRQMPSPQVADILYPRLPSPVNLPPESSSSPRGSHQQSQIEIDKQMLAAQKKATQRARQQSVDLFGTGKPRIQLLRSNRPMNVDTSTTSLNIRPDSKNIIPNRIQLSKIASQPHLYTTTKYAPSQMGRPQMSRIQSFDSNLAKNTIGGLPPKPKRVAFVTVTKEEEDERDDKYESNDENDESELGKKEEEDIVEEDEDEVKEDEDKLTRELFGDLNNLKKRFD